MSVSDATIDSSILSSIAKNKKKLMKLASDGSHGHGRVQQQQHQPSTKKKTVVSSLTSSLRSSSRRTAGLGAYSTDLSHNPNIEHLVYGSYRSRPSPTRPSYHDDHSPIITPPTSPSSSTSFISSSQTNPSNSIHTISSQFCECKAHSPTSTEDSSGLRSPSKSDTDHHHATDNHRTNCSKVLFTGSQVAQQGGVGDNDRPTKDSVGDVIEDKEGANNGHNVGDMEDDMSETIRPDNITFFLTETSLSNDVSNGGQANEWMDNNRPDSGLESADPVESQNNSSNEGSASNCGTTRSKCTTSSRVTSVSNNEQVKTGSRGQSSKCPAIGQPLKPAHIKNQDNILRAQQTRSQQTADRSRLILDQLSDEINNQLLNSSKHKVGGIWPSTYATPSASVWGARSRAAYDQNFRRQNSLPSFIPKPEFFLGSSAAVAAGVLATSTGGDDGAKRNPVTFMKRTAIYSPIEGKVFAAPGQCRPSLYPTSPSYQSPVRASSQFYPTHLVSPTKSSLNYTGQQLGSPVYTNRPLGPPPPYSYSHHHIIATGSSSHGSGFYLHSGQKQRANQSGTKCKVNGSQRSDPNLDETAESSKNGLKARQPPPNMATPERKPMLSKPRSYSLTNGCVYDERYPFFRPFGTSASSGYKNGGSDNVNAAMAGKPPQKPSSNVVNYDNMYVMDEDMRGHFSSPKMILSNSSPYYGLVQTDGSNKPTTMVIDARPGSTFSSPEKRSASTYHHTWTPTVDDLKVRSQSEHQLSAMLLTDAHKQSVEQLPPNSMSGGLFKVPPRKPPRAQRPWSQLVTNSEVSSLRDDLFGQSIDQQAACMSNKQVKSDSDVRRPSKSSDSESLDVSSQPHVEFEKCRIPASVSATDVDTVMSKFKKSFSLRFSRIGSTRTERSGVKSRLRQSLRAKSVEGRSANCLPGPIGQRERSPRPPNREHHQTPGDLNSGQYKSDDCLASTSATDDDLRGSVRLRNMSCVARKQSRRGMRRSLSQPGNLEQLDENSVHQLHQLVGSQSKDSLARETESSASGTQATSESEADESEDGSGSRHGSRGTSLRRHRELTRTLTGDSGEVDESGCLYVEAVFDHIASEVDDGEELSFRAGEVIEVTDSSDSSWWWGSIGDRHGWFPFTHVRMKVSQEETVEECMSKLAEEGQVVESSPKKRMSISLLSNEQVRSNCVRELITTERDFFGHLNDIVEGYLVPVGRHKEMFTDERISRIFGNISQLYAFQQTFLAQLEACINWEKLSDSLIGDIFLANEKKFEIYSDYCNNHPLAVTELQELYSEAKYAHFFEACRLLRNMIDISLDGFLLTPVQKICKYPLQLAELLKYTRHDHPDYEAVKLAFEAMRRVAELVNERKRRLELLEYMYKLEKCFDNWEGAALTEANSCLLITGDLTRICSSNWSQSVTVFLFDHLLVYCKRDLLGKRLVFKGQINMDTVTEFEDVPEGQKDQHFNVNIKHAIKLHCGAREKWFMFAAKTAADKVAWLKKFDEQKKMAQDDLNGTSTFKVTDKERKAAQAYLVNRLKTRPNKRMIVKGPSNGRHRRPDTAIAELDEPDVLGHIHKSSRAGSLPSYLNPKTSVKSGAHLERQSVVKKKGSGWFNLGSRGSKSKSSKRERPIVTRVS